MEWVTIATFTQPTEAHVIKGKLESEGVEAIIADEHVLGVQPLYSHAIGGAKVQVKAEDVERARDILSEHSGAAQPALSEVVCPDCQSKSVKVSAYTKPFALIALILFFFPFPFLRRRWQCEDCNYSWRGN